MASIFATAVAAVETAVRLLTNPGIVTIRRGSLSNDLADCGLGQTRYEIETAEALTHETSTRDLFVPVADYDFGDGAVEPAEGDTFEYTLDGQLLVFEVAAPEPEPAWRLTGAHGTQYRIHGIQISGR